MNLHCWRKTIKLLNLPTVCPTSITLAVKLKKVASNLLTEEAKHVDHVVMEAK